MDAKCLYIYIYIYGHIRIYIHIYLHLFIHVYVSIGLPCGTQIVDGLNPRPFFTVQFCQGSDTCTGCKNMSSAISIKNSAYSQAGSISLAG